MHGHQQGVRDRLQLGIAGLGLRPLRGEVHMVNGAQDVIDISCCQNGLTFGNPSLDQGDLIRAEWAVAMRLYLAVVDVDGGNLFHVDAALAVLGIDPKHHRAVFADPKVIVWQIARHGAPYFKPAQKPWMRLHASSNTLSAVA